MIYTAWGRTYKNIVMIPLQCVKRIKTETEVWAPTGGRGSVSGQHAERESQSRSSLFSQAVHQEGCVFYTVTTV